MPRVARKKDNNATYHIMCRSISEIDLFMDDDDKSYYLDLLKRYLEKYSCQLYTYCLMSNHLHLEINTNGFDISKLMHCLNTAYVRYFNKKYQRRGPLFQDRFLSKIVDSESYFLAVSAYIHNNPKDLPGYNGNEIDYPYSSYGIYAGKRKDSRNIVDISFVLSHFSNNIKTAVNLYVNFVEGTKNNNLDNSEEIENKIKSEYLQLQNEYEYKSEKFVLIRNCNPKDVINKILSFYKQDINDVLCLKNKKKFIELRSVLAFSLRVYCGLTYKKICQYIGNITSSGVASLIDKGFNILNYSQSDKNKNDKNNVNLILSELQSLLVNYST